MNGKHLSQQSEDYARVEKAIRFVEKNFKSQPSLDQIAESVHLSKYHFDRLFKRWAGISPMQFLQFITLEHTKQKLAASGNLLDTSLEAGLSGPGRLHDLFVTFEAVTPGEFKKKGRDLEIDYGFGATPFGECLLAVTARGICYLGFVVDGDRPGAFDILRGRWPDAALAENTARAAPLVKRIFSADNYQENRPFNLLVKGTNYQVNVWRALLKIPKGQVVSYQDIAAYIGHPSSSRAVANAVAANPVGYLIPCHRVIRKSGWIHGYRWGDERKNAILGWEEAGTR